MFEDIANKSRAVPARLQGLGLGHVGWHAAAEVTVTGERDSSHEPPTVEATSGSLAIMNTTINRNESECISPNDSAADSDSDAMLVFTPLRVDTSEWNTLPLSSGSTGSRQHVSEAEKKQEEGQGQEGPNFYRQFKEKDLFELRAKFRPEVNPVWLVWLV
jgi:hypothetical protein